MPGQHEPGNLRQQELIKTSEAGTVQLYSYCSHVKNLSILFILKILRAFKVVFFF